MHLNMVLIRELRQNDPDEFKNYLRMDRRSWLLIENGRSNNKKKNQDTIIMREYIGNFRRTVSC